MKNLRKNRKAITPVTAAIAVISGMVGVAIVVALLVGSIASSNMANRELAVSYAEFTLGDYSTGKLVLNVDNPSTKDVTISIIKVNGQTSTSWSSGSSNTIAAGGAETFTINHAVVSGTQYAVDMYDSEGTLKASCTKTA
jgi:P pilus assembly chaperone PapD